MTNNIKTEAADKTETKTINFSKHFKDSPTINHRTKQTENLKKLLDNFKFELCN